MKRSAVALPLACLLALAGHAQAAVFINELHYDDAGAAGDSGEGVEIVATAGESLSGYKVYLYNGSNPGSAAVYATTAVPAGSLVNCGGQVRIATVGYASNGVQNGPNDGLALVDGSGQVLQFLSYEGAITGGGGPAAGLSSQNLPVSESNSTAAGTSLQLRGSNGSAAADFSWAGSSASSFGACNSGQSFSGGSSNAAPSVTATTPAQGASNFPAAGDLAVTFNEAVTLASGAFGLSCSQSGTVALSYPGSGSQFAISTNTALAAGESCSLSILAAKISDAGGAHPAQDRSIAFSVASGSGGGTSGYYARVNTSNASQLRCSLHETIKGHTVYPYSSSSGTSTWTILEIADEDPNDSGRILDAYRNRSYAKGSDRAGSGSGLKYNREHSWPNSLGFGTASGDKGLPYAPYTDTHMLYLTDSTWNADRGNKPYANCDSTCGERITEANAGFGGGSGSYPGNSNWVRTPDGNGGSFEVWNHRKGDMARAVMYMAIRYEGGTDAATGQSEPDLELTDDRSKIVQTSASPAYMGLLSTLLAWSQQDPPDATERARNEVVYSFQGNRNPFIDHPEWATSSLFTSAKPASCQLLH
ncbi:ribonuclease [Xanthomonas translucens pv. arrhenatheri]|uniref:Ribonuclease n=1 Tax=Xanthomonas graminis pv. arrhenatheri LMG 727 TaxID=1195923 RepID=A0A0K2ZX95_9XANT|nr:endonuclease [Xanthomonas translucens]OAX65388.1 ribonuclease [Xanthomonas translucens pv. arrhenatheri]UKE77334.1 endonuclease [Xanthomonas translucens pv. arrhenatheri]CTP90391.1 ribonuclease [Xanthomonas translucens pv. arrhenatheri LMG 727]